MTTLSTEMAPRLRGLLDPDPGWDFGTVLPLAKKKDSGELSMAMPGVVRGPLQGLLGLYDEYVAAQEGEGFDPERITEGALALPVGGALADTAARPIAKAVVTAANKGKTQAGIASGLLADKPNTPWPGPSRYTDDEIEEMIDMLKGNYPLPRNNVEFEDLSEGPVEFLKNLWKSDPERMQRAKDMGFDTDRVWYHGTPNPNIEAFNPKLHSKGDNINQIAENKYGATFFASNPEAVEGYAKGELSGIAGYEYPQGEAAYKQYNKELKKLYKNIEQASSKYRQYTTDVYDKKTVENLVEKEKLSENVGEAMEAYKKHQAIEREFKTPMEPSPTIMPVLLRRGDTLFGDFKGTEPDRGHTISSYIRKAMKEGKSSVVLKNIMDPDLQHQAAIFDPKRIRSIFAQFRDPESNDLLAANRGPLAGLLAPQDD